MSFYDAEELVLAFMLELTGIEASGASPEERSKARIVARRKAAQAVASLMHRAVEETKPGVTAARIVHCPLGDDWAVETSAPGHVSTQGLTGLLVEAIERTATGGATRDSRTDRLIALASRLAHVADLAKARAWVIQADRFMAPKEGAS